MVDQLALMPRAVTHAALAPMIGPAFDPFLVAVIGEDRNEKSVSVLSALAQLDVDPWDEVANLALHSYRHFALKRMLREIQEA